MSCSPSSRPSSRSAPSPVPGAERHPRWLRAVWALADLLLGCTMVRACLSVGAGRPLAGVAPAGARGPSLVPAVGAEAGLIAQPNAGCIVMGVSGDACELLCLDLPRAEAVRSARPDLERLRAASGAAKALADPTRLTVAVALRDGEELCGCDLAWICERSDNLVSHHARALRAAGLASSRREGKMVLYSLTAAGRELLEAVLSTSAEVAA